MSTLSRGLPRVVCALLLLVGAWLASALALGQTGDAVAIPSLQARVTDLTGTLSAAQQAQLEQQLASFEKARGSQIAILVVPTTQPEVIEQFSIRVAEAWKIGRRNHDDGVLITVAKNDRKMRIDVGYGLEGAIPDAIAKRIISETMAPKFRQGDFAGGLSSAVTQMEKLIEGESLPAPAADRPPGASAGNFEQLLVIGLMLAVVGGTVLRAMFGRLVGSGLSGGLVGAAAWFITGSMLVAGLGGAIAFLFVLALSSGAGRRSGTGGWGGGWPSGGSGGSWGGDSGGWSGGGGGFGGGGASGDW